MAYVPRWDAIHHNQHQPDMSKTKSPLNWDNGTCKIEGSAKLLDALNRGQRMRWHDAKSDPPRDNGHYLTLVRTQSGSVEIEIAPWCNREYNGGHKMGCYFEREQVTHWMPLPKLPPVNDDCDES